MVPVAVENCTIEILPPVMAVEGVTTIEILTPASQHSKVNGNGIYSGDIQVLVSGATYSGLNQVGSATITISPNQNRKDKVDNKLVIVAGDQGQTENPVTFQTGQTSAQSIIQIMVTDAGQDKVEVA